MDDAVARRLDLILQRQADLAGQVTALHEQVARLEARLDTRPTPHADPLSPTGGATHPATRPTPRLAWPPAAPATPGPDPIAGPRVPAARGPAPVGATPYRRPSPPQRPLAPNAPEQGPPIGSNLDVFGPRPLVEAEPENHGGVIAKVFAFAGAGVLLIGIGLLLVLAAQAGYFGPVAQVIFVAVLAAVLFGLALWLRRRSVIGSITLAAVAFAAAYLDVAAVTALHEWIPRPVGLAIGGAIALAGLLLGRAWRSSALATIVSLGVLILVPLISPSTTTSLGFAIGFAIASLAATWGLGWAGPQLARLVPLSLFAVLVAASIGLTDPDLNLFVGASVLLVLIGLTETVVTARFGDVPVRSSPVPEPSRAAEPAPITRPAPGERPGARNGPPGLAVVAATCLAGVLMVPSFIIGVRLDDPLGIMLLVALGVGLLLLSVARLLPAGARGVSAAAGSVWLPTGVAIWLANEWNTVPFVVTSLVLVVLAWAARSTLHGWVALVHAALTVALTQLFLAAPFFSAWSAQQNFPAYVAQGTIALATVWAVRELLGRLPWRLASPAHEHRHLVVLVSWLLTVTMLSPIVVGMATWLGDLAADADGGFRVGHGVVTLLWFAASAVALITGLRTDDGAATRRGFGLALAGVALLKLLIWDLSVLSGLVRVGVAIVTGLLLIGLGIWYARALERQRALNQPSPAPHPSAQHPSTQHPSAQDPARGLIRPQQPAAAPPGPPWPPPPAPPGPS